MIDNSSMADRDPTLTVDKNGQRHFSQMAWINKRPTTRLFVFRAHKQGQNPLGKDDGTPLWPPK